MLVVCPTSVLRQWARELREKVSGAAALTVLLYHGAGRSKNVSEVARYDVVLTARPGILIGRLRPRPYPRRCLRTLP